MWAETKIKLFSEYGHVAYQIKADNICSKMVANVLLTDKPLTQGVGSKRQKPYIFVKEVNVAYQIKENLAQIIIKTNMLSLHTATTPGWGQKVMFFFSKSGHVAYQIKLEEG